jgi:hypothetical protein
MIAGLTCGGGTPSPAHVQNIENKEAEKNSPCKIFHRKELQAKSLIQRTYASGEYHIAAKRLDSNSYFCLARLRTGLKSKPPLRGWLCGNLDLPLTPYHCFSKSF